MIQDYASHGLVCIPPKFWCYVYKTMAQHTALKMSGKGAGIKMIKLLSAKCSKHSKHYFALEVLDLDMHTASKKDGATPNCRL